MEMCTVVFSVVCGSRNRGRSRCRGMIGSRRKIALMWKDLEEKGYPRERLEQVHAPIGLDIGSDSPEEIAVSVVAELIQVRRSGGKPEHNVRSLSAP